MLKRFVIPVAFACACSTDLSDGSIPAPPDAGVGSPGSPETFAIDTILLGDATRGGDPSTNAWKEFGYDLDGLDTSASSTDVCMLHGSAPSSNQLDGVNGTDNAWGATITPLLETATSDPAVSTTQTSAVQAGAWTLELTVDGVSAQTTNAVGVRVQLFVGGPLAAPASFAPTMQWPVLASSLTDVATLSAGAKLQTDDAFVENGRVFARFPTATEVMLSVFFFGIPVVLRAHDIVLSFVVNGNDLADGTFAGILETEATVAAFQRVAANISASLCGAAFNGFAEQLRQAQDILADGTNAPGVPCNAISIGLGFTARKIANPTTVIPDPPPLGDPCVVADAGADGD